MKVYVRDFGYRKEVSLSGLEDFLRKEFLDNHISVEFKLASGIVRVDYVSVSKDGSITDSYTGEVYSAGSIEKEVTECN